LIINSRLIAWKVVVVMIAILGLVVSAFAMIPVKVQAQLQTGQLSGASADGKESSAQKKILDYDTQKNCLPFYILATS
jgi:hypothetical protein